MRVLVWVGASLLTVFEHNSPNQPTAAGCPAAALALAQGEYSIGTPHNFQAAAEFRPLIDQLYHDLCER